MKTIRIYDKKTGKWEYTLTSEPDKKGIRYTLFYSEATHWNNPGKELLSITDTGDNFKFDKAIGKSLEYDFFTEIQMTMQLIKMLDNNLTIEYEFIDTENIKSI